MMQYGVIPGYSYVLDQENVTVSCTDIAHISCALFVEGHPYAVADTPYIM